MSYLKERSKKINAQIVQHKNCFIPQIEAIETTAFNYVVKHFQSYLMSNYEINKIIVIDPYMTVADLQRLTLLFGGNSKNILEVVTKFEAYRREEVDKEQTIQEIVKGKNKLVSNGVFKNINIYHSQCSMHDRYFIFGHNERIISIFTIGGSINQNFENYINIQVVSDMYLWDSINHYHDLLKENLKAEY